MKLDVATLKRVSPLLDEVLDLEVSLREEWLARLENTQADMAPIVRELLAKESLVETNDFLERGPEFTAPAQDVQRSDFSSGDFVGPYRLIRELGVGGMGEVWLAERADGALKRSVALKLPMLSLKRSVLVQRFERERDILASLTHPNIARLYDAGFAENGQPYLALENVEGEPITEFARKNKLDTRGRIGLILQVMNAVQYAHANLVIHRDLKPANVLVSSDGKVHLLDFGIAKLLEEEVSQADETELTRIGGRALTLSYAAPEQVTGSPVSTATDVYALGVLLYEILTQCRPFNGSRIEVEQGILNAEPQRPKGLAADLTNVVLKALKKIPAERYVTVAGFANDLDNWLTGKPVSAQPDKLSYRLRKFVGRHRIAVGAGVLMTLVIIAASGVSIWQANVAREQATVARTESITAKAVQSFLLELFQANSTLQSDPEKARQMTARELLDRGAARIDEALGSAPQSRIEVMGTMADMYNQLGLMAQAEQLQRRQIELARQIYGERDNRLTQILLDYVETLQESDRREELPKLLDQARAVLTAAGDDKSSLWGDLLLSSGHFWKYESLLHAQQTADEAVTFFNHGAKNSTGLVTAQELAARASITKDDFEAGEIHAAEAIKAAQLQGHAAAAWQTTPTLTLADALTGAMKYAKAESILRDAIELSTRLGGEALLETLTSKARLGNLLLTLGRSAEGDALHESVRSAMRTNDPRHDAQMRSYIDGLLAKQMMDRGRPDLMAPLLQSELENLRRTLPRSPLLAHRERALALSQAELGQFDAARQSMEAADTRWSAYAEGMATPLVNTEFALSRARIALAAGDPVTAVALLNPTRPATSSVAIERYIELARANMMLGQLNQALEASDSALHALSDLPKGGRPVAFQANALLVRGRVLLALHDVAGATSSLESALALRRANDLPGSLWLEQTALALADAASARGNNILAASLRAEARKMKLLRFRAKNESSKKVGPVTHIG